MSKFATACLVAYLLLFNTAKAGDEEFVDIQDLYKLIEECGAPRDLDYRLRLGLSVNAGAEDLRDSKNVEVTYSDAHQMLVRRMYELIKEDMPGSYYCTQYSDLSGDIEGEFSKAIGVHWVSAYLDVLDRLHKSDTKQ